MEAKGGRKYFWLMVGIALIILGLVTFSVGIIRSTTPYMESEKLVVFPLYTIIGGIAEISFGLIIINEKFRGRKSKFLSSEK